MALHDTNLGITYFSACGKIGKQTTTKKNRKKSAIENWLGLAGWGWFNPKVLPYQKTSTRPYPTRIWTLGAQPKPTQPVFHTKNGFNPKNRVGFGRTSLDKSRLSSYLCSAGPELHTTVGLGRACCIIGNKHATKWWEKTIFFLV